MIVVYVGQFAMFVVDEVYILVVGSIDKYAGVGQMIDEAYKVGSHYHLDREQFRCFQCVSIFAVGAFQLIAPLPSNIMITVMLSPYKISVFHSRVNGTTQRFFYSLG